jgi:hypothetical protein
MIGRVANRHARLPIKQPRIYFEVSAVCSYKEHERGVRHVEYLRKDWVCSSGGERKSLTRLCFVTDKNNLIAVDEQPSSSATAMVMSSQPRNAINNRQVMFTHDKSW